MGIHHSRLPLERSTSLRMSLQHPTTLVSLLLNQEWDKAIQRIQRFPREARQSFLIRDEEARSVYPLHVACAFPEIPLRLIKILMEADPEGPTRYSFQTTTRARSSSRVKEDCQSTGSHAFESISLLSSTSTGELRMEGGGWLPLHVAVYYGGSTDVVEYLLERYPSAILCKNGRGLLPLHLAVERPSFDTNGNSTMEMATILIRAFPESLVIPTSEGENKTAYELVRDNWTSSHAVQREQVLELLKRSQTHTRPQKRVVQSLAVVESSLDSTPRAYRPQHASKLAALIAVGEWEDALKRLHKKPHDAMVWTMTDKYEDPPCHLLPLHMALRRKAPFHVVQALLQANPNAVQMREYYGMLPLHIACQAGLGLDVIRLLITEHADAVRVQDLTGLLPLHLACNSDACRKDVIVYLLEQYPESMDILDEKGFTPLHYVQHNKHPHQACVLKEFGRGHDYWAATPNTLIQLLLEQKWNDSLKHVMAHPQEAAVWTKHPIYNKRRYALHYACKYKAPTNLVEVILESYPDAAKVAIDDYQLLPLHLACQFGGSDEVVKLLLESYKQAASIPDSLGLLPLHLAITEGASVCVVEALLEAYPQAVHSADGKGFLPHVYAESSHHPNARHVMELLSKLTVSDSSTGTKHGREAWKNASPETKRQKSDRSLMSSTINVGAY